MPITTPNFVHTNIHPFLNGISDFVSKSFKSSFSESIENCDQVRGSISANSAVHTIISFFIFQPFKYLNLIHQSGLHSLISNSFYAQRSAFGQAFGPKKFSAYTSMLVELTAIVHFAHTCSGNYMQFENTLIQVGFVKEGDSLVVSSLGKFFFHFFKGPVLFGTDNLLSNQLFAINFEMRYFSFLAKDLYNKSSYIYQFLPADAVSSIFYYYLDSAKDTTHQDFDPDRVILTRDLFLEFNHSKTFELLNSFHAFLSHDKPLLRKEHVNSAYAYSSPNLFPVICFTLNPFNSDGISFPAGFISKMNTVPTVVQVFFGTFLDVSFELSSTSHDLNIMNFFTPFGITQLANIQNGMCSITDIGVIIGVTDSNPSLSNAQIERTQRRAANSARRSSNTATPPLRHDNNHENSTLVESEQPVSVGNTPLDRSAFADSQLELDQDNSFASVNKLLDFISTHYFGKLYFLSPEGNYKRLAFI
jgi:hypothetical protein